MVLEKMSSFFPAFNLLHESSNLCTANILISSEDSFSQAQETIEIELSLLVLFSFVLLLLVS